MFVITADQRHSRRGTDLAETFAAELNVLGAESVLRTFQRTAGDEIQGVVDSAETVVHIVLLGARGRNWSIGVGIGPVRSPLPAETRAGSGAAFELARDAVSRAKSAPGSVACSAEHLEAVDAQALLQLLAELERRRSEPSQEAGELMNSGISQREAAQELGISQQAFSQRLHSGLWQHSRALMSVASRILDRINTDVPDADVPSADVTGAGEPSSGESSPEKSSPGETSAGNIHTEGASMDTAHDSVYRGQRR